MANPDFFAVGHEKFARVNSQVIINNPENALNSFWSMPFKHHAKITFTNDSKNDLYFTKEDIRLLVTGKIVEKEASYAQTNWLFMLQDIGFDTINEILKRSPIYSEMAGTF